MIIRTLPLLFAVVFASSLSAQKTGTTTAKVDHLHLPTLPVRGVSKVGIQVYTADLPFDQDTLRYYLGNMDLLKSSGERLSKVKFQALTDTEVLGGEGDITIRMAFGHPIAGTKEQLDAPCMVPKDGCKQYYYKVAYQLPAALQAVRGGTVLESWELDPNMTLQFGNEQVETQSKSQEGSTTTVRVVSYASLAALEKAYATDGANWLARKAAVVQLGRMVESMYPRLFFLQEELKFDLTYGKGDAADYSPTVQAAEQAAAALTSKDYTALAGPIAIWEEWLERADLSDKKAAVNPNVAEGLHGNMAIACAFTGDHAKARAHLEQTLKLAQQGMVNTNKVEDLKQFRTFIMDLKKSQASNGTLNTSTLVDAPDIKKQIGRRKYNEALDFLIAEDKYAAFANTKPAATTKDISEMNIEEALSATVVSTTGGNYGSRASGGTLVLSILYDMDLNGKPLPDDICALGLSALSARDLGLTSVPECIGQLSGLERLQLDGNALTELPESIGMLTSLTVLDISDNQLSTLPEGIYKLTALKKLTVSGNPLSTALLEILQARFPDCKIK